VSDEPDLAIAIDLGTGGPKIALVTLDGEVLSHEVHHVRTDFGADGAATQDAVAWWSLITASTQRLLAASGKAARVRAVAVTGLYASTVPVDANGVPTGPCLTWLDTRGGRHTRRAIGGSFHGYQARKALAFVRKAGGAPSTSGADPIGHMLYLVHDEPELVARTAWFMEPVDYLTMRFTGTASATHASRSISWLTDNRDLSKYEYDSQLLAMVHLDAKLLPPLRPIGSIVGTVKPDVASSLGLSRDVAVITGVPDVHAAALGTGATRPYETHLALSTTSWISCPVPRKKTDINHSIASVPGLTNDSYVIVDNQETGAKSLDWLRALLGGAGSRLSFEAMTDLAATSPPGANGAIFTPWLAGERSPVDNRRVRGGFTNLSVTTTTADVIRAVMEGVAANAAWLLTYVERFTDRSLSPIRALGGGAQSSLWCQICADTMGREVEQVPEPLLAQLRGATLLASVALGRRRLDEVEAPIGGVTYRPGDDVAPLYRARARQFPSLYERDRRWSRRQGRAR